MLTRSAPRIRSVLNRERGMMMMSKVGRPLRQWPRWNNLEHQCLCSDPTIRRLLFFSLSSYYTPSRFHSRLSVAASSSPSRRSANSRPGGGLRSPESPPLSDLDFQDSNSNSDTDANKSRNEKKREARRAVRWGMDLASFSPPQIKRILRVASLEREVFEALMLVKRLGPDVREGKRRQFNYIGRLLRNAEPELMDALIQAMKDGDQSKLQSLSSSRASDFDDYDDNESEDAEDDDGEEVSQEHIEIAARWFDGLVNRDSGITNEVYSVHSIEFDRQELRKLVRKVQLLQDEPAKREDEVDEETAALVGAKKSLTCFLRSLAMQLATE